MPAPSGYRARTTRARVRYGPHHHSPDGGIPNHDEGWGSDRD